jgi:alpha-galactosidase
MTEYIPLKSGVDALLTNHDVHCEANGELLSFEYRGIHLEPISTHYPLVQFENQVEVDASLIGDGFQMLCQTAGTPEKLKDIGRCPDNNLSYRIYPNEAPKRFYNYLVIEQSTGFQLFGFTSCHRFAGYFELHRGRIGTDILAYIDGENSEPQHWASNRLESIAVIKGTTLESVYLQYSELIAQSHPVRKGVQQPVPIGWCSWYAYYADVTEQLIKDNLRCMQQELPELEWVLLDDGYQAYMGDWLTPSDKFPGGVKSLIQNIRESGKKPAIWLAPFIAQAESEVFQQHPDWFLRDSQGHPLKAEEVTYGGWRCTPWYVLDASNPEVIAHLTHFVSVMRNEWGVEMFKLDANYWGTLKGVRQKEGITGVEAYRMGMEAIIEGAGDALILGCNAPMWPSLGLVDAMRVSDDVERDTQRFEQIAKETFYRSWQHQKLWLIDPDCATFTSLANQATERASYEFHRNVLLASGGMLLSGDPLPELTGFAKESLKRLIERQKATGRSAEFHSLSLNHGYLKLTEQKHLHCLFHSDEEINEYTLTSDFASDWYDFWTGEKLNEEPTQLIVVPINRGLDSRAILSVI